MATMKGSELDLLANSTFHESKDFEDMENGSRAFLPPDVMKRFEEVDNHHKGIVVKHRKTRHRLLSVLSGGSKDSELDGWAKFLRKVEDDDANELLQKDLASFIYGCDRSIMRSTSPEDVWGAVKRRSAFKKKPLRMSFLVFTQCILCFIIVLSPNNDVNYSTVIMAGLYILANASSNPLKICNDLIGYIKRGAKMIGQWPMALLCAAGFPVLLIMFTVTLTLDMTIGDIIDLSYAGMMNQIVHIIVIFTAISVGLRSGNPINAIQTFAGFDFIDSLDETVINSFEINYEEIVDEQIASPPKGDSCKILTVRLIVYGIVPVLMAGYIYLTYTNHCYIFCTDFNHVIANKPPTKLAIL